MQPYAITDPPLCFTVGTTARDERPSPTLAQYQDQPSDEDRLIFVSSLKMTVFQSAPVQYRWSLAKAKISSLLLWLESRAFQGSTVCSLTVTPIFVFE